MLKGTTYRVLKTKWRQRGSTDGIVCIKMSFLINNLYTYKVLNALFYMLRPLLYYQRSVGLLIAF